MTIYLDQAFALNGLLDYLLLRVCGTVCPQRGPDAGQQHVLGEGLGYVVVGSGVKPGHDVPVCALGGQHDDRRRGRLGIRPKSAAHRQPVHSREHDVEQYKVWTQPERGFKRRIARCNLLYLRVFRAFEGQHDYAADGRIVLNDEYLWLIHDLYYTKTHGGLWWIRRCAKFPGPYGDVSDVAGNVSEALEHRHQRKVFARVRAA